MLAMLFHRITNPVLKYLSTGQDFVVWALTFLPLLTGYIVAYLSIWFGSRVGPGPHGVRRALPKAFVTSLITTFGIGGLITALL